MLLKFLYNPENKLSKVLTTGLITPHVLMSVMTLPINSPIDIPSNVTRKMMKK